MTKKIELNGLLTVELDHSLLFICIKNNEIRVDSDSFSGLKKIFTLFRRKDVNYYFPSSFVENSLTISYFINNELIAQSGSGINSSWYGKYLGLEKLKIKGLALLKTILFKTS